MFSSTGRSSIKSSARRLLGALCLAARLHRIRNRGKVLLLMYHRVLPREAARDSWVQPGMYVTPNAFRRQLQFMKRHFQLLSLGDLLDAWEAGSLDPKGRYCIITFDDGWLDNYTHAFPVLRALGVPATIFLATSFVGTGRWFFPERLSYLMRRSGPAGWQAMAGRCPALRSFLPRLAGLGGRVRGGEAMDAVIENVKTLSEGQAQALLASMEEHAGGRAEGERQCLDWTEVREMSRNGISFGSHSESHRRMHRLSAEQVYRELTGSGRALAREGVRYVPVFCYPNGDYTREVKEAVRACGYRAAVTARYGVERCGGPGDLFEIKRMGVHQDIASDEALLSFHLSDLPRSGG